MMKYDFMTTFLAFCKMEALSDNPIYSLSVYFWDGAKQWNWVTSILDCFGQVVSPLWTIAMNETVLRCVHNWFASIKSSL